MSGIYNDILRDLEKVDGVKRIALGSRDGFLMGGYISDDTEMLTLMSATMLRAAETATNKLEKASARHVIVDFEGGKLIAANAGQKALISVIATQDASIDTVISELEKISDKIKGIF